MTDRALDVLISSVSRETHDTLAIYAQMIRKWNPAINLISKTDIGNLYERHLLDSLQILENPNIPSGKWVDLGSGGGLPGIVVAIDAKVKSVDRALVLIESDQRKATFLREVIRQLDLRAEVIVSRIESVQPMYASVVSARALAPIADLCAFADRHLADGGMAVFHKGENRALELAEARNMWHFELTERQSVTNEDAAVLYLMGLRHV